MLHYGENKNSKELIGTLLNREPMGIVPLQSVDLRTEASFKTKYPEYMHHLIRGIASCDECLVAYTSVQAYAYDGEIWHEIIEVPSLSEHK